MKSLLVLVLCLAVCRPAAAGASFLGFSAGEDTAILSKMMWDNIKTAADIHEMMTIAREASDFARETAGFARESVQTGKNLHTLLTHPNEFMALALKSWQYEFPEVYQILSNAYTVQELLDEARHPQDMDAYDSMAYKHAFDALANMTNGYEALAHAIDYADVNASHDSAIEALEKQYQAAVQNLEGLATVINTVGLSPVQASVYTANATSISAVAQVQAAATLERISRTVELAFANEEYARGMRHDFEVGQEKAFSQMHLRSWELSPMKPRRQLGQR